MPFHDTNQLLGFIGQLALLLLIHSEGSDRCGMKGGGRGEVVSTRFLSVSRTGP